MTLWTTLVPMPSFRPILRMPSPFALNSSMRERLARSKPSKLPRHRTPVENAQWPARLAQLKPLDGCRAFYIKSAACVRRRRTKHAER
jgi:hypothetical protein